MGSTDPPINLLHSQVVPWAIRIPQKTRSCALRLILSWLNTFGRRLRKHLHGSGLCQRVPSRGGQPSCRQLRREGRALQRYNLTISKDTFPRSQLYKRRVSESVLEQSLHPTRVGRFNPCFHMFHHHDLDDFSYTKPSLNV